MYSFSSGTLSLWTNYYFVFFVPHFQEEVKTSFAIKPNLLVRKSNPLNCATGRGHSICIYTWGESMIMLLLLVNTIKGSKAKFIIDLCRTVAFKLPLVTLTPTIHNTNSKNDIISFFLCSPWTSEMNLVGQANGKIISKNSCNFQNSGLLGTCTGMENSAIKVQDQEGSKSKRSLDWVYFQSANRFW